MLCPNCNTEFQTLEVLDKYREVIKLTKCPHCGSFWLDEHELGRIDADTAKDLDDTVFEQEGDLIHDCPRCHIPLQKHTDSKHNNVTLQVCHECLGIYLKSGMLAKFFGIQPSTKQELPDRMGLFSSRDRMLTSIISVIILSIGAGLAVMKQTGMGTLSADELYNKSITPYVFYSLLVGIFVIFIIGLILAFSKMNHTIRLLGWSSVLLSIALVFILSV